MYLNLLNFLFSDKLSSHLLTLYFHIIHYNRISFERSMVENNIIHKNILENMCKTFQQYLALYIYYILMFLLLLSPVLYWRN